MTRPEPGDLGDGLLAAHCWCEAAIVAATIEQVRAGTHLSCGRRPGTPAPVLGRNPHTRRGRPPKPKPGQPCD